ncbi:M20/M25/M40 family metallo-hydrolase [Peristeroidobacter soli]|uniref:M20/M25/M40 family metallo-hydrolase n=1 Tax=Peristeroidobacter soli TaxID=2497877 RepID=UPI00101C9EF6|nr:M20/M25/M40 family metallo-hydrolase [Peristeroidobacter soli]
MKDSVRRQGSFLSALPLLVCLVIGVMLAASAMQTPAPVAATAPATVFSAERAMQDVRVIAQRPHPIGSADAARVRDYIAGRLQTLGLQTHVQRDEAFFDGWRLPPVLASVENVVGVLAGRSPELPAIVIMSHYDTVPTSPGAGDDTAGVATALELAANLRAGEPLDRTVIFLFTDGEEVGLLGAAAFFESDPLSRRVGVVLNMEARGTSGRAMMFETSERAGDLVRLWSAHASLPVANSLMGSVYRRMPNGTDLTVPLKRGLPGLNFAFLGDQFGYHTMVATPERLDVGSLQHLGDQVLPIVLALAKGSELPAAHPDVVHFDVLGKALMLYPTWIGWGLAILAMALVVFAIIRTRRMDLATGWDFARGASAPLLVLSATALCLQAAGAGILKSSISQIYALFDRHTFELAGAASLAGGIAVMLVIAQLRGAGARAVFVAAWIVAAISCLVSGSVDWVAIGLAAFVSILGLVTLRKAASAWGYWLGGLATCAALAAIAQGLAPLGAFMLMWPILGAAILAVLTLLVAPKEMDGRVVLASGLLGTVLFAQLAYWAATIFGAVGALLPLILAPFATVAVLVLFPLIRASARAGLAACAFAFVAGALLVAYSRMDRSPSVDAPETRDAFFIADVTGGRYYRASTLPQPDEWSWSALQIDGAKPEKKTLEPVFTQPMWLAETGFANAVGPTIAAEHTTAAEGTQVVIRVGSPHQARQIAVHIRTSNEVRNVTLNGHPVRAEWFSRANEWGRFTAYATGPEGLTLRFDTTALGRIEVHAIEIVDGWPAGLKLPAAPPAETMPARLSENSLFMSHIVIGAR